MERPDPLDTAPTPGAAPKTPHPVRDVWRGIGNVGLFFVESLAALLELFWPPRSEVAPPKPPARPHPVEKTAPFPIND